MEQLANSSHASESVSVTQSITRSSAGTQTTTLDASVMIFYQIWNWSTVTLMLPLWPVAVCFDVIVIIVFSKSKMGTTKITRLYYKVISAADLIVLASKDFLYFIVGFGIYFIGLDKLFPNGLDRWTIENHIGCSTVATCWFASEAFVNYVYVLLNVERLIALYFPFKVRQIFTKRKLSVTLLLLALFNFAIAANWYGNLFPVRNPYMVRGYGCSAGGSSDLYHLIVPALIFCNSYVVTTLSATILSALIVLKIRKIIRSRVSVLPAANNRQGLSSRQMEYFLTPLIISALHALFYLPVAAFRLTAILLPYVTKLSSTQSAIITGLGFDFYTFVMPVHLINFCVYSFRIPGFFKCATYVFTCRCSRLSTKCNENSTSEGHHESGH